MKSIFKCWLPVALAGLVSTVNAQDAVIKGNLSSGKSPLAYVNVIVNNSLKGTYTDDKGNFKIEKLIPGEYILAFSSIGFEPQFTDKIIISKNDEIIDLGKMSLEAKNFQISEITISVPQSVYSEKHLSSNHVVTKAELERTQPIGTEEVLKKVAGVNVSGDQGISNRLNIGIRGSYPRRAGNLIVLEDGSPIAPAPYLAPEAYYNPPTDRLDGIEIIKGADILTYGTNSMYGVVNYITKRPPAKPTLGATITGGENGYKSQFITYGGTWNNVGAELQVLNKSYDGFQDNNQMHILNVTSKVFAELGSRSSIYLKMNYHQENSKTTYSG
ncbi:MAG: carboxypeptidase-like regulatory domain-containing protein, partial [Bacteroidetes bacterium]|nr:carboxypeptidase-like regulatory domain-containing protein [Bacteroidota bacterium]